MNNAEKLMNNRHRRLGIIIMNAVFFFSLASIFPSVHAHKPLASDNNNVLEGATKIPDHKISWAIYQELEGTEEMEYYRFSARQREIGFLHAGKLSWTLKSSKASLLQLY
jgi:hypothetical protein